MNRAISLAASVATAAIVVSCGDAPVQEDTAVRPVRAIQVGDVENLERRGITGKARAAQEVSLAFRVPGRVEQLTVDVGEDVKKGAVLGRLDPSSYKAEVARLKADQAKALAALANAVSQLERDQTLYQQGHIAKARLDRVQANEQEKRAQVASTAATLQRANLDLGYTVLKAPFAGSITAKFVNDFEDVAPQQPVLRLLDDSQIEMLIDVPENIITIIDQAQDVQVVFDAFPEVVIPADIKEISTEASQTTRTYPVTLIMDQPDGARILPGMAGRATARPPEGYQGSAGIVLPEAAVFTPEGGSDPHVWIVDEAALTVSARPVSLGRIVPQGINILTGVEQGEWVVTAGAAYLTDGQSVRLLGK